MTGSNGETRWWWIRHAPVTEDGGCVYGQIDVPSNCSDRVAFSALAAILPRNPVLVTSHLRRTTETAAAIGAAGLELPEAIVERAFAEQHFGDWQGINRREVFRDNAPWHEFWLAPATTRPPGGESFSDLVGRARDAIDRLTGLHAGRDIVAVAHGGTIRAALCVALDLDPEAALSFSIDNLSLTRIDQLDGGPHGVRWRVSAVNVDTRIGAVSTS
ncbi:MAG: histidine phosphatase family protein [Alphaproteobacteria bacterium]|nr:histidine phosphatase family protein [Alphaproteobacteria bacterium]